MSKRYEVLERSFINGRLYESGETVVLEIDSPGGNLKQMSSVKTASQTGSTKKSEEQPGLYIAKHNGGGRFIVVTNDQEASRVGEFVGTKAEAEAEAERLNQGGDIAQAKDAPEGNDIDLPDA